MRRGWRGCRGRWREVWGGYREDRGKERGRGAVGGRWERFGDVCRQVGKVWGGLGADRGLGTNRGGLGQVDEIWGQVDEIWGQVDEIWGS